MACSWIGVGVSYPQSLIAFIRFGLSPRSSNFMPYTALSSFALFSFAPRASIKMQENQHMRCFMPLRVAVQMDPIDKISHDFDSTFALMVEACKRGHEVTLFRPCDLSYLDGR